MKRQDGFDLNDNNVYYPNTYKPSIAVTSEPREFTDLAGSTRAKTQANSQIYKYFTLRYYSPILMAREMCHHHSIGQKAEFVSTVNNLAATKIIKGMLL